MLWLFGLFAATGSSAVTDEQAEAPVSELINDFGPPVAHPAAKRQRAAMPTGRPCVAAGKSLTMPEVS